MTKYTVKYTTQFKKDLKNASKSHRDIELIKAVVTKLANGETLTPNFRDHALTGDWKNYRECHIQPDWLLIYKIENDILVLTLARTGSHSTLFSK